jgi:type VI secretion system protein ImpA
VLARAVPAPAHARDLRLLVIVARALTNERGPEGLADGLTLIARTLEEHWDTLHPELRASPNPRDAALRRINALLQLQNADDGLLGDLRRRTFFTARGLGPVSGQDLERGTLDGRTVLGEAAPGMNDKERAALVADHEQLVSRVRASCAALADQSPAEMAALADAVRAAAGAIDRLEQALGARLGAQTLQTFLPDLKRTLERVQATLERAAAPAAAPEAARTEAPVEPAPMAVAGPAPAIAPGTPGRIATREEVIACLDRIIEFYDRTEPASPVPFLARRMRRMVPMDFLELMEDLAPSGLKEFRALAGLAEDKKAAARTQGERT